MTHTLIDLGSTRRVAFVVLLLIGAFCRLYGLDRAPLGVHQDELSDIYDGYSIAQTGADRFGERYPLVLRAFGENDNRPALPTWLAAIAERFAGFSVVAGRMPTALLGVLSLVFSFGFARAVAGNDFALLALLFATLSPLHIQLSRVAGGVLTAFFFILILYLWQASASRDFPSLQVVALGFATGFSSNSYQAAKLTAPLLAIAIGYDILRHASRRLRALLALAVGCLVGALPQIVVLLSEPERFTARAKVLSVTGVGTLSYVATILHNYWLNIEPGYLFVPRMLRGLTVARLIPVEICFFYVGLLGLAFLIAKPPSRGRFYIYTAFAVALLPAAITTGNPSTMRSSGMAILTPLFSAAGVIICSKWVRNQTLRRRVYYPIAIASIVLAFGVMTYKYARSEYFRELSFQKIAVDMGHEVGILQSNYDAIFIERYVSEPYIYIAAFAPISPREFQKMPKRLFSNGMDAFTQLGKYYFVWESTMPRTVEAYRHRAGRFLFISPTLFAGLAAIDSVSFQNNKLYFQVVKNGNAPAAPTTVDQ